MKKTNDVRAMMRPRFWIVFLAVFVGLVLLSETVLAVLIHILGLGEESLVIPLYVMPFAALIIAGVVFYFYKRNNDEAEKLIDSMNKLASGDYSVRLDVDKLKSYDRMRVLYHNFNLMAEEISSVSTLREEFVSEFSHEFKTPISSINGFANLLSEGGLTDEERDKFIKIIADESVRLWNLADNALAFSTIKNQRTVGETEDVKLDKELSDSIIALQTAWDGKNIEIGADMQRVCVHSNGALLRRVWTNLLNNAIKFTPEGGEIKVKLVLENGGARVSVTDSGVGISAEDAEKIFEPYYRAKTAGKAEGSGLGLAICKRICALCGGEIFLESGESGRCTFAVVLPNATIY